jgi:hypothetical protein
MTISQLTTCPNRFDSIDEKLRNENGRMQSVWVEMSIDNRANTFISNAEAAESGLQYA